MKKALYQVRKRKRRRFIFKAQMPACMDYFKYAIKTFVVYVIVVYVLTAALLGDVFPVWDLAKWPNNLLITLVFIPNLLVFIHIAVKYFVDNRE